MKTIAAITTIAMKTRVPVHVLLLIASILVLLSFGSTTSRALAATQGTATFDLLTDIADGVTPLQDLFVERADLPADQVIRIRPEDAQAPETLAKMMYGSATEAEEDLFQLTDHPLGPFPKGKALGFTVEQWLAAKGQATYTVTGDEATLEALFRNLVPNAVYTMWCVRMVPPPDPNPRELESLPCGAPDGSQNVFKSDANGSASYRVTMKPLAETTDKILTAVGIAYHSDGQTCGNWHCEFGLRTHVHLSNIVPALAASTLPSTGAANQTQILWFAGIIGALVILLGLFVYRQTRRA